MSLNLRRDMLRSALVCASLVLGTAGQAFGGPDVITANLHQTEHWGAESGIRAYSVGTVSCNIGDEPLLWESWSANRPVIGQNLFRLKDGRFEHLGQSWLKWAFASLNQDYCGDCEYPGSGSLLGVNCSDPYSAWLNGMQSRLGPKSSVNPFTGELPADHDTPGTGTIDGRVQVATSDVDPSENPDAAYFVEGQYVAPDDAESRNQHNNASYRRVWVESDYTLTFNDPDGGESETVRTEPAIYAWADTDPLVGLTYFDLPGDGRIFLAWRPRHLGGGVWDYEFALQNLNSDRGLSGFAVALPPAAVVSSSGFHDVHYHSGEPYDGTDWAVQVESDAISWTTDDYDTDPNANALRWGTLYNFRFQADVPPSVITSAQYTAFKPGTPTIPHIDLPTTIPLGDTNCDGSVDFDDIDPFVLALSGSVAFEAAHPDCDYRMGDSNLDGTVDFDDIDPFVAILGGS